MIKLIGKIERVLTMGLLGLMMLVVIASVIELVFVVVQAMLQPPRYLLLDINELLSVFGFFLFVLIGLELLASVKMYMDDHVVHVELIMLIALIAVSRKIIVIDYAKTEPMTVFGIALLTIVLSAGYFLVKRSHDAPEHS